jgi:hypothetical protein
MFSHAVNVAENNSLLFGACTRAHIVSTLLEFSLCSYFLLLLLLLLCLLSQAYSSW